MRGGARSPGRFITIEGGEGAGKSTQARVLCAELRAAGIDVVLTREPGGSTGAESIRNLLVEGDSGRWDAMTETLLHFAARRDHVTRTIRPALASGAWVVCDRFADSTLAYQGAGHGVGVRFIETLLESVVESTRPDLTIMLDIAVALGLSRAAARGTSADRYERMGTVFHERVRAAFREIARAQPERCVVVDAGQSAEQVQAAIRDAVRDRLGMGR